MVPFDEETVGFGFALLLNHAEAEFGIVVSVEAGVDGGGVGIVGVEHVVIICRRVFGFVAENVVVNFDCTTYGSHLRIA